jgi:hypothetical protein
MRARCGGYEKESGGEKERGLDELHYVLGKIFKKKKKFFRLV